jgi:hypothetical protein
MKLFLLGAMVAYTPALVVLAVALWRAQPLAEVERPARLGSRVPAGSSRYQIRIPSPLVDRLSRH